MFSLRRVMLAGILAALTLTPLARAADDVDLDVAIGLTENIIASLEAGELPEGLATSRQLRAYLKGEDGGDELEGLGILRRIDRIVRLYELSAEEVDQEVVAASKAAVRAFQGGIPGQPVYYPNGKQATYRFGAAHSWYYPNEKQIVYRPTPERTWYYSNDQQVVYRPTDTRSWYYPNGKQIAYRPTSDRTWYYANEQQIAYRPTNTRSWYYPNGQQICYRLGQTRYAWYFPDGTLWKPKGPAYSNEELARVVRVITRILEDSGWADDRQASGPRAASSSGVAATLRRLEGEMLDRLRYERSRALGANEGTVGDLLGEDPEARLRVHCHEEVDGYRIEIRDRDRALHLRLDQQEVIDWDGLEISRDR